ncbi:hypothetical protein DMENIID0001_073400 [Sergentomyia squamirostris]
MSSKKVLQIAEPGVPDDSLHSQATYERFLTYFPAVLKDIQEKAAQEDPIEKGKHVVELMEFQSAEGGKKYCGICTAESFKMLKPEASQEEIDAAFKLGWCVEMMNDGLNLLDDIMDKSLVRREKACWYLLPGNEVSAADDAWIIQYSVQYLMIKYFKHHRHFPLIMDMYNHTMFKASYGQWMDVVWDSAQIGTENLTMDRFNVIADNISVYIAGVYPLVLGMVLAGYTDPEDIKKRSKFFSDLGYFYIVQDDYMDYFSPIDKDAKIGTDIQEGKCRWLASACLQKANPKQLEYLKKHFGKPDRESVEKVIQLFVDMKLPEYFHQYTDELHASLMKSMEEEKDPNMKILKIPSPRLISDDCFHSEAKRQAFMTYLPGILKEIEEYAATADPIEKGKHVVEVIEYQGEGGKKYGGVCTAETYQVLAPDTMQSPEDIRIAYILGWCVELLFDSVNMVDDIMDKSQVRRNKPCWYTLQKVKELAANDAWLINNSAYFLLNKYFGHRTCFPIMQELFNNAQFKSSVGQWIEMKAASESVIHPFETFKIITEQISVYIAGVLPIRLGMTYAGYTDPDVVKRAHSILYDLGFFYNVQDDFMDSFSPVERYGKTIGTDIKEGKCTWLSVKCLERASPVQTEHFKHYYGKNNQESVDKVRQLYIDLKLPELYHKYTSDLHSSLLSRAEQETDSKMKTLYHKLFEPIIDSNKTGGLFI